MRKLLTQSNPYLRDEVAFDRAVYRSVATSSAIEGITAPFAAARESRNKGQATKTSRSKLKALRR